MCAISVFQPEFHVFMARYPFTKTIAMFLLSQVWTTNEVLDGKIR